RADHGRDPASIRPSRPPAPGGHAPGHGGGKGAGPRPGERVRGPVELQPRLSRGIRDEPARLPAPGGLMHIRKAGERGRTDWGWLDSRHTFSFGEYHDDAHMGFRSLRVINDDRVKGGAGFGTHGHRDMEILSYVLDAALAHKDSAGGGGVIRPGELQFMRAGTGVTHSEYNHSKADPVHFLQVWIVPEERGLKPAYGQLAFDREAAAH